MQKRTGYVVENTRAVFHFAEKRTGKLPFDDHISEGKRSKNGNLAREATWSAAANLPLLRRSNNSSPGQLFQCRVRKGGGLAAALQSVGEAGKEKRNIKIQKRTGYVVENTGSVFRFTQKRTGKLPFKDHPSQGKGRQREAGPPGAGKEDDYQLDSGSVA